MPHDTLIDTRIRTAKPDVRPLLGGWRRAFPFSAANWRKFETQRDLKRRELLQRQGETPAKRDNLVDKLEKQLLQQVNKRYWHLNGGCNEPITRP